MLGDMGNGQPGARQVLGGHFAQLVQFLPFNLTKLAEINFWQRHGRATTGGSRRTLKALFHPGMHVFLEDTFLGPTAMDLGQIHAHFPGQLAHRRAGVHGFGRSPGICRWRR